MQYLLNDYALGGYAERTVKARAEPFAFLRLGYRATRPEDVEDSGPLLEVERLTAVKGSTFLHILEESLVFGRLVTRNGPSSKTTRWWQESYPLQVFKRPAADLGDYV